MDAATHDHDHRHAGGAARVEHELRVVGQHRGRNGKFLAPCIEKVKTGGSCGKMAAVPLP